MERYFWEEVGRSGALLGLVLALSMIVERELLLSGSLELLFGALAGVFIAVHFYKRPYEIR